MSSSWLWSLWTATVLTVGGCACRDSFVGLLTPGFPSPTNIKNICYTQHTLVGMTTHYLSHGRTLVAQGGTQTHGNVVLPTCVDMREQRNERHIIKTKVSVHKTTATFPQPVDKQWGEHRSPQMHIKGVQPPPLKEPRNTQIYGNAYRYTPPPVLSAYPRSRATDNRSLAGIRLRAAFHGTQIYGISSPSYLTRLDIFAAPKI